jgi:biopolymer transport protein ExbB
MRRIFLFSIALLSTLLPSLANAWWQPDWSYRKPVTIDAGPQGGALSGDAGRTPVLVRLHTGNFSFEGVSDNGADIRFVASDDKTVLSHQIEQFDPLLGIALIWVDVPAVTASAPQQMYMYYGNSKAPAGGNGQRTFDADYTAVYHFVEPNTPARDTTAYANNAQTTIVGIEGAVIGKGAQLNGSPLMLPASPSLAIAEGSPFTFSIWVRPEAVEAQQIIYSRRSGNNSFLVGIDNGSPFVQINGSRTSPAQPIQAGQWSHLAVTAAAGKVTLFVGGHPVVSLDAALPAFNTPTAIGVDVTENSQPVGTPFVGAIDEVRLSKVARPAPLLMADALSQGADSRLVVFGEDEQQVGKSHFGYIIGAMPLDAWIVIGILGVMMVLSWLIMISKSRNYSAIVAANQEFLKHFRAAGFTSLEKTVSENKLAPTVKEDSSLWRLYKTAIDELNRRKGRAVTSTTIDAIRASLDGVAIRENERMSNRMNWLSTAIEGAPYVGLFGTVIGIMLVFVVAAMAGAVDINSVAPGMAAALLCTAAGLGVAIPALFGYNWLASRSDAIAADMAVFIDEIATRLAEEHVGREVASREALQA